MTIINTNLYSGGTLISNSTVFPGNIGANSAAWGTGPITLAGGTVQFNGYGSRDSGNGWGGCTNTINVPVGQTGTLLLPARFGYAYPFTSPLTGGGTLNMSVEYVRGYMSGDWSAFTGRINVSTASGYYAGMSGDFRINNTSGYANAAIFLNGSVNMYNINANNQTTDIGELGGASSAFIGAGGSTGPTWRIGAKNTTNTYAGIIADAGVTTVAKTGTGMLVLSGANTYSGGTTVNGGTLMASNVTGSATGAGVVTVNSGGVLAGNGIITGAVTVNSGGGFAPGTLASVLTISNNLTLAAGSTNFMQLRHSPLTNTAAKITGTFTEGGTLIVTNVGPGTLATGDSFRLFNAAGYAGSFAAYVLPPLGANQAWRTSALNTSGILSIVTLTPPVIGRSAYYVNGSLIFGGTGMPTNWTYRVLSTTNVALPLAQWTAIATNQTDGSGSFSVTNGVNVNSPQTFYRLQFLRRWGWGAGRYVAPDGAWESFLRWVLTKMPRPRR